jgi:tetratricopeptide (TPR) repeat protein
MPDATNDKPKGVCFAIMGFGKKTDFETGRTLDLDKTYKNIIKPAAEDAGLECIRADEIIHSGVIDVPMYEQLLNADVVVADLSTSNKNAFYELGIRHALRPYTTIIIAEDGMKAFPFDLNHVIVRQYHHLGEDIGYSEVMRFRADLTKAIKEILATHPPKNDSPIYTFFNELTPPALPAKEPRRMRGGMVAEDRAKSLNATPEIFRGGADATPTYNTLMQLVEEAEAGDDFKAAKTLLARIRDIRKAADPARPEDPTVVQRHARATYKSKEPTPLAAYRDAMEILSVLEPETTNDTETLGLWGAIQKNCWNETHERPYLDQAIRAYSRGFYLRNDYYNGINFAFLLNVRAANAASKEEAIADFVQAKRIREEVLKICEPLLARDELSKKEKYWVRASMAEAYAGLGDETNAKVKLDEANAYDPLPWMKDTTDKQLTALKGFLANSPLQNA